MPGANLDQATLHSSFFFFFTINTNCMMSYPREWLDSFKKTTSTQILETSVTINTRFFYKNQ